MRTVGSRCWHFSGFRRSRWLVLSILLLAGRLFSQDLQLISVDYPDTVAYNMNMNLRVVVHNNTDSSQLGNLKIWFKNLSNNNLTEPLGGVPYIQFMAPGQQREFEFDIPVSPNFFRQGGNTVVIWPSLVGQPVTFDTTSLDIFVRELGFLGQDFPQGKQLEVSSLVDEVLSIRGAHSMRSPIGLVVYDLQGRRISELPFCENCPASALGMQSPGIYLLEIRFSDRPSQVHKVVKTSRQ